MDSLTHLGYTHVSRFRLIFTLPFCIAFAFMHIYIHAWTTDRYNRYYHIEQGRASETLDFGMGSFSSDICDIFVCIIYLHMFLF